MKKNNKQPPTHCTPDIFVSFLTNTVWINNTGIRFNDEWNSCNYREEAFLKMTNRDRRIEYHLMAVNALLVDYHYHTSVSDVENDMYISDHTPVEYYSHEETRKILEEARYYNEYILQSLLKDGWETRQGYLALSLTMMAYIYDKIYICVLFSEAAHDLEAIMAQAFQSS